jgi:hypothetical protein
LRNFFQLALLLSCVAAHAQIDRNAFTFTHYDLQVQVTPADQSLSAKGTITLRNDSKTPQRHAALQVSSALGWKRIDVATKAPMPAPSGTTLWKPAQYISHIDHTGVLSEAIVYFPEVAPGGTVELRVEYSGTIARDATRLTRIGVPEARAVTSDWDTISDSFTAVRGVGYVCWYPVSVEAASLSSGTDVFDAIGSWKRREAAATMQVEFTFPNTLHLRTDGDVLFAVGSGFGSTWRVHFTSVSQIVPTFALAPYRDATDAASGTTVSYTPGHESAASDYVRTGAGVAPLIAQWFGPRKREVRIVELSDPDALAYDAGAVLFTPLRTIERKALELILAHQLTHATFDAQRPWMYEGLASFAEALAREQQDGRASALQFMQSKVPVLAALEKSYAQPTRTDAAAQTPAAANSLVNTSDDVLYRTKAMFAWWMLRDMIGDTPLQHALARYRPVEDKQPAYVQQLLETESKKQLEWFFDDWVYRDRGLPDFKVDAAFPRPSLAGTWGLTVTVENLGGAAAEVPVTVHAKQGERSGRVQVPAHAKAVVRIVVPDEPLDAVVNDGSVPESNRENNSFKIEIRQP